MNILLAPDKFKGSLTALEVCEALSAGLIARHPLAHIRQLPMADGGDGTLQILSKYLELKEVEVDTVDPLGRPIRANYLSDSHRAFIEVASASGLVLLNDSERNPLATSTYGTGLMVRHAVASGVNEIYLLLGGSATNDAGLGIASALGVELEGVSHSAITGGDLLEISAIRLSAKQVARDVKFTLLCDVSNPLFGPQGAAYIYAEQKGANMFEVEQLDRGLRHVGQLLQTIMEVDFGQLAGAGAAGGIAASLVACFGASLKSGFDAVADLVNFKKELEWADLVITGEGQLDEQSLQGKVVGNVLETCKALGKPCYAAVGHSELAASQLEVHGFAAVNCLTDIQPQKTECMRLGADYLRKLAMAYRFE